MMMRVNDDDDTTTASAVVIEEDNNVNNRRNFIQNTIVSSLIFATGAAIARPSDVAAATAEEIVGVKIQCGETWCFSQIGR